MEAHNGLVTISPTESQRLIELETIIEAGRQTFIEVGTALAEIRDSQLYKAEHKTFEDYCREKWGWTASRARQICTASEVAKGVTTVTLSNERQARALAKVPPANRAEVMREVVNTGRITATRINEVAAKKITLPPSQVLDNAGWPIPTQLIPLWRRSSEVQDMMTMVSRIKGVIKRAEEDRDKLYRKVSFGAAMAAADTLRTEIEIAKPYAVCTSCQGQLPENCTFCKGVGFISEHAWKTHATREDKEFRQKALASRGTTCP